MNKLVVAGLSHLYLLNASILVLFLYGSYQWLCKTLLTYGVRFLLCTSWCWFLCSQTWGVMSKGFACRKTGGSGSEVKHTQILSTCKNSIASKWGYCIVKMHCLRLRNTEKWVNCSLFLIYSLTLRKYGYIAACT